MVTDIVRVVDDVWLKVEFTVHHFVQRHEL